MSAEGISILLSSLPSVVEEDIVAELGSWSVMYWVMVGGRVVLSVECGRER